MWNPEIEALSREDIEQLQLERLQSTLNRAYYRVSFYRQLFDGHGVVPEEVASFSDLAKLPFTTKEDLRQNYPYGMFAVPLRDIVRLHSSTGTTGTPTVVGYTRNDLKHWSELTARVLVAGGVGKEDILQIAFDYGMFTGALGLHYGAELVGATVVPISGGNPDRQIQIMKDFRTTGLLCTPSYALFLAERMEELGVSPAELSLRVGLFGAEPWSEEVRRQLEERLNISATDNYGLSEVMGPGVSGECEEKAGLHIAEDHFIPEVVDPETGEVLPPGEQGELVLTTIAKEALPLIRYRTGDITRLVYDPCPCGRTHVRMERVSGRTDDMLIIRGVNVFPSQVESVLMAIEGTTPHYQLVVDRSGVLDELEVWVEVGEELFSDEIKKLEALEREVRDALEEALGISVRVRLVEPKTLERTS
ncbi:MAG TPA: phenylacetate--CoA ligase family protein [Candidatus Latescibacteria bacterium]|nr:phenylacetate--CoA ligase family protein [Candidatus Latescibacterota bacterium]